VNMKCLVSGTGTVVRTGRIAVNSRYCNNNNNTKNKNDMHGISHIYSEYRVVSGARVDGMRR
jgi:hypothetical protein